MPEKTTHVRFEMNAAEYTQLRHRAIDEGKTITRLLRELVEAGIRQVNQDRAEQK